MDLTPILDQVVDWRDKGFPPTPHPVTIGSIGEQGWHALDGDLLFPVMLLKESALDHNIDLMARYCREWGVELAPHGKTPVAPQMVERQLRAGAWGITAATLHQTRVFRAFGVNRILLANELLEPVAFAWLAAELDRDPDFEFLFLVDSLAGVEIAERALGARKPRRKVRALVELGTAGGRSGARTLQEAVAIANAVRDASCLELAGVEGYEGAINAPTLPEKIEAVDAYLRAVRELTLELARCGSFEGLDQIVVSAGGSNFFDRVVEILTPSWDLAVPVRVVLRSGSYFTHDVDGYQRLSPLAERGGGSDRLQPALELWAMVLSRPEPELAIANFGKRDVSYDLRLPIPFAIRQGGQTRCVEGQIEVTQLNDQHAFLRIDPDLELRPGDLMGLGISHPCTAWDKWRLVPLVDDAYGVTGAIRTFF